MENTTTEEPIESGVEASTQPAEVENQSAEQPQEPVQETMSQAPSEDDTATWLSSKGYNPNDPDSVMKLAKSYREAEKLALSKAQEASELRKSLGSEPILPQNGTDPTVHEFIQDYRRDKQITSFKEAHPDWNQHEPAMVDILSKTAPNGYTYSQLVNAGFVALDDVYIMAKGKAPVDTQQIQSQAKQEVLQSLANTQRAGGGNAHASNPNSKSNTGNSLADLEARLSNQTF